MTYTATLQTLNTLIAEVESTQDAITQYQIDNPNATPQDNQSLNMLYVHMQHLWETCHRLRQALEDTK